MRSPEKIENALIAQSRSIWRARLMSSSLPRWISDYPRAVFLVYVTKKKHIYQVPLVWGIVASNQYNGGKMEPFLWVLMSFPNKVQPESGPQREDCIRSLWT